MHVFRRGSPIFEPDCMIGAPGDIQKKLFIPMNKVPHISVVLPFRNASGTLERAVSSILRQSSSDFELILVDNHSTDGSSELAAQLKSKDKRILLLPEPKEGVVPATNRGVSVARGKYICRMDADDEALPLRLRQQLTYLEQHEEAGAVGGLVEYVPHCEETGGFERFVDWNNELQSFEDIYLNRFIEIPVINPTLMWRRETMELHGLYREGDFPEDYEMVLRWLEAGVRIGKVAGTVLKWYDSDQRLTRTDPHYSENAFYRIKSRYLARWLEKHNPHHPTVSVWGASRISRRRARYLEEEGIETGSFIDTRKNRQIGNRIIYYKDLPPAGSMFILSYIRQMDNRDRIRAYLKSKGYREGKDFLMVS